MPSSQTSRGQAAADGSVEAGLADTRVWVKDAAQLDFTQAGDLGVTAPLVLQRKLVTVQHQRAQTALETILGSWRDPRSTLSHCRSSLVSPGPWTRPLALHSWRPHLGAEKKRGVRGQGPEAYWGPRCSAALHVAVIQRQEGVVPGQLQGHGVPEAVIYGPARDSHNSQGIVAVQLEPESAAFDLRGKEKFHILCLSARLTAHVLHRFTLSMVQGLTRVYMMTPLLWRVLILRLSLISPLWPLSVTLYLM